jgi:hypothetical protein
MFKTSNLITLFFIIISFLIAIGSFKVLPTMIQNAQTTIIDNQKQELINYSNKSNDNFEILGRYEDFQTYDNSYQYIEFNLTNNNVLVYIKYEDVIPDAILMKAKNTRKNIYCFQLSPQNKECYYG